MKRPETAIVANKSKIDNRGFVSARPTTSNTTTTKTELMKQAAQKKPVT
jgi:hypothetical protein